tara:strand:+ start:1158 stop:1556 length:399 start_codon:yes stop_codon:yes gene_type:complete
MKKDKLIQLIKDNTNKLINDNDEQKDQIEGVYNHIYDKINDLTNEELKKYLDDSELSFYCVNEDYFMIYYDNCNKFIDNQFFNMFNLLSDLDETESVGYMLKKNQNNYSNLSSEKFVNMYAYVIGSHILEYK